MCSVNGAFFNKLLEEFGIRCMEISRPPLAASEADAVVRAARAEHFKQRTEDRLLADLQRAAVATFREMVPPANERAMALAYRFLRGSMESIFSNFPDYQIMPIQMKSVSQSDILCFGFERQNEAPHFIKGGAWWAYALGQTDQMPKNDMPNLSVNTYPWGLDVSVNAELIPSQRVVLQELCRDPPAFDRIVHEHGGMVFQAWFKLAHQPRFYHWFPVLMLQPGDWNAKTVRDYIFASNEEFAANRNKAIAWLEKNRPELSQKQVSHLTGTNRIANIALRFVDSIGAASPFWAGSNKDQIEQLNCSYAKFKPLIDFFHGR